MWRDNAGALTTRATVGQRYRLCRPKTYSLRELVRYVMLLADDRRAIIGLPPGSMSSLLGAVLMHCQVLTTDNVRSMSVDNVTDAASPAFAGSRAALEDIAPTYLGRVASFDEFALARERPGTEAPALLAFGQNDHSTWAPTSFSLEVNIQPFPALSP